MKGDTIKTKVNSCSTLIRFEQTLYLVWLLLWSFFKQQLNIRCNTGTASMLIASHIHNAPNCAIVKSSYQTFFEKFEVLFSTKQQGAIRSNWKIYSCIFYHLCIMVIIFKVATSLSIFSTTRSSLVQYRKQMKCNYILTYTNWNINLIIGFGNYA